MKRSDAARMYAIALVAALGFAGASGALAAPKIAVPAPGAIKAPEKKDVVVQGASPAPNIGYLPLYVGQKMGYFQEEGLEVKINYSHGDSVSVQALDSGEAQVMSGTPEVLFRSYEKGLRGVLFYQTYYKLIYSVAVPEGSPIKSPAGLAGKTIGVSSMGSTALIIAKMVAKDAGADPASLKFLPVGIGQQALAALKSGHVDALALWDAAFSGIETNGDLKLTHWRPQSLGDVADGGYFSTWETMQKQPNTIAHFTRAIAKSMVAIHRYPAKALEIYWQVNPSGKPKGTDEEAHKAGLKQLEIVGQSLDLSGVPKPIDEKSFAAYIKGFVDQGIIDKAPPVDELVTNAFVPIAKHAADEARK